MIKKRLRVKRLCMVLVLALMVTIVPASLFGQHVEASTYSPFHDVTPNYWALPHIVKMETRGIIQGTGGGIFAPENTVTQLQAITMAVRAMGLENLTHNTETFVDTSSLDLPTSWNARGYTSVAITQGLVDVMTFRPNAGASRAWIAQLLIRMIGASDQLVNTASTDFQDDEIIPVWAKPSVALAVEKGLITGVAIPAGGFNYLPNNAVKRSELAALISRADRFMQDVTGQLPIGQLASISSKFTDSTLVYDASFKRLTVADLKQDDMVRYVIQDGALLYVEVLNMNYYDAVDVTEYVDVSGRIEQHFANDRLFTIRDSENNLLTKRYSEQVVIKAKDGKVIGFGDLALGEMVNLTLANEVIVEIRLAASSSAPESPNQPDNRGTVYAIDLLKKLLTVKIGDNIVSYEIDDQVRVINSTVNFPTIRDLRAGDVIEFARSNQVITMITVVSAYQSEVKQGTIVSLNPSERIVTVRTADLQLQAYQASANTVYTIRGVSNPSFLDLIEGDVVVFKEDNKYVSSIEVVNRGYSNEVIGEIVRIDHGLRMIILQDERDELRTYRIRDSVSLYLMDKTNPTLHDFHSGERAIVTLDNNIVQSIAIRSQVEGAIVKIDPVQATLVIVGDRGQESYHLSSQLQILSAIKSLVGREDLREGDEAIFYISQNQIHRIELKHAIDTTVAKIDLVNKRIHVSDGATIFPYHTVTSSVVIDSPELTNATLNNIEVQSKVRLYYDGHTFKKVWLAPPDYGRVVGVDRTRNELLVRVGDEQRLIRMDSFLLVHSHTNELFSAYELEIGDYVKMVKLGNTTRLYRAEEIVGEFVELKNQNSVISYYNQLPAYRESPLHYQPGVWKNNQWITLADLKSKDHVILYMLDNRVVGIQVR